jgi:hypothetical protein
VRRRLGLVARPAPWRGRRTWRWESAVAVGVVGAIAALWMTLQAQFLAHPGWLAIQKADFILGPILVGLYWRRRRPDNRLGLWLIALGLLEIPYILESSSSPWLFTLGTLTEWVIWPMTLAVILAFPNGRLDGPADRLILAVAFLFFPLVALVFLPISPQYTPFLSISGCRALCPADPLFGSYPAWGDSLIDATRAMTITVDLAAAGLLVWRFVHGTPPRRRSLAIGAPIALCFLLVEATYQMLQLINPQYAATNTEPLNGPIQWVIAASRSTIWYGFLFALIAAELFAGGVLRDVVRRSLGRPSLGELEGMLREPLGDPGLRLGFWREGTCEWAGHDGAPLEPRTPGQRLTEVDREGRPAAAIIHDDQLSEDPELLQAGGAAALLAQENAELDAAWKGSLRELAESRDELAESRARLATAADKERRKLERNLHDGAQQRLVAATINPRPSSPVPLPAAPC